MTRDARPRPRASPLSLSSCLALPMHVRPNLTGFSFFFCCRLAVNDCAPQTSRVSSNLHSSSSMAVSRVPSPPPPEVNTPVAENWCYTQVGFRSCGSLSSAARTALERSIPRCPRRGNSRPAKVADDRGARKRDRSALGSRVSAPRSRGPGGGINLTREVPEIGLATVRSAGS